MKTLHFLILSFVVFCGSLTQAQTSTFDQASYDRDMQRSRLENTWQFHGTLGIGALSTDKNSELSTFSNSSGFGIPVAFSLSVYHPRSTPGLLHWGYFIEGLSYQRKTSSLFFDETYRYKQSLIGVGVLYYFNEDRKSFLRANLGSSSASVDHETDDIFSDPKSNKLSTFNGMGTSIEIGNTFQFENFKNLFTYSAHLSYLTAENSQDNIQIFGLSAHVGILW